MKAQALVPALALAAALLASPLAEADSRHRSERGGRPTARGYYGHQPSHGSYGHGARYGYGYRPRPQYYRSQRYYAPPSAYYGYGYGGYDAYGYGYYPPPPPPPRYYRPRPRVGFWFGF
jgi:hypothetical protein